MNDIPEVLKNAFQVNSINPEAILEIAYKYHYYIPEYGTERFETKKASVLDERFFYWSDESTLKPKHVIAEASLLIRYKKGDSLESLLLTGNEDLLSTRLWMMRLFKGKMKGSHELSLWYQKIKQEELADYVSGNTIDLNGYKYPLRVSKVTVGYNDLWNVVSSFEDFYNQDGQELAKRGFRIPTLDEWLYFADSVKGKEILKNQYKDSVKNAYEICAADSTTVLQINVATHQLEYLDFGYRRVHPGPLRDGFYRYVQSPIPSTDLFPAGYINPDAKEARIKAEVEYEEYLEKREPWDC